MSPFTRQFMVPPGYYQAIDVLLTGKTVQVVGGFSAMVWVMWITPGEAMNFATGGHYEPTDARQGLQFNYDFTPPWTGMWKLLVWNRQGVAVHGQLTVGAASMFGWRVPGPSGSL